LSRDTAVNFIKTYTIKTNSLGLEGFLPVKQFRDLPEEGGIYRFYDSRYRLMYIGRAQNIRMRVYTHVFSDHSHTLDVRHNFKYVYFETLEPSSNRKALENYLINTLQPPLNYQSVKTYQSQRENPFFSDPFLAKIRQLLY